MKEASKTALIAVVLAGVGLAIFCLALWGASFELTRHLAPPSTEPMLAAQQRAADWTMIAAIVAAISLPLTAAGIFFVYLNLREAAAVSKIAAETLEQSRETRIAELRAYLLVDTGNVEIRHGLPVIRLNIRNVGSTPAQNVTIAGRVFVSFDGDISRQIRGEIYQPGLAPTQSIVHEAAMSMGRYAEVSAHIGRSSSESYPVVSGTLKYQDIFKKERITAFRLLIPHRGDQIIDGELRPIGSVNWMT